MDRYPQKNAYRLKANRIRDSWANGGIPIGTFVFSHDAAVVETVGRAGFDFALIDMEHTSLELRDVEAHIRAAAAVDIAALVRVPNFDGAVIGRVLDSGADGIVFPHFGRDRASSRLFAENLRYAPNGHRPSCTGVRSAGYGLAPFAEYVGHADDSVLGIGLIEDVEVIPHLDAIFAESRIDAIMPGPGDLATALGLHGQPTHPRVRAAVDEIMRAARRSGLRCGMYLNSVEEAHEWVAAGADFLIYLMDSKVLALAYEAAARSMHRSIEVAVTAKETLHNLLHKAG